jgi:hypothetical protein
MPAMLPDELATCARRLLATEGVDPSYVAFVAQHLDLPDGRWRWCCGSSCDPCVERLGRVVDGVRAARAQAPS